jgi:hypothetical protein
MTTTIVQFPIPDGWTREQVEEAIHASAPLFQNVPGLIRKHYLASMESRTWGGAYIWESREQAEAFYGEPFIERIRSRYGATPSITHFDSPLTIDNAAALTL